MEDKKLVKKARFFTGAVVLSVGILIVFTQTSLAKEMVQSAKAKMAAVTDTGYEENTPDQVTGVAVTKALVTRKSNATVSWEEAENATSYVVELLDKDSEVLETFTTTETSYVIAKSYLVNNTKYYVRVAGVNDEDEQGEWSASASFVVPAAAPVKGKAKAVTTTSAVLTWKAPAKKATIKRYAIVVYRADDNSVVKTLYSKKKTRKLVTGLESQTAYKFKVRFIRKGGIRGQWSKLFEFTTK
ncbi:MAG TPA: fibronectin type III domain-containing protein [Patescibacteria group bacterium]|nr:fibronectin type III domain-containing protein [Patescibacteria group bacterium]